MKIVIVQLFHFSDIKSMNSLASTKMSYNSALLWLIVHFKRFCHIIICWLKLNLWCIKLFLRRISIPKINFNLGFLCIWYCSPQIPNSYSLGFTCNQQMLFLLTKNHWRKFISGSWIVTSFYINSLLCINSNFFVDITHFKKWFFGIMPVTNYKLIILVTIRCEEWFVHCDMLNAGLMVSL